MKRQLLTIFVATIFAAGCDDAVDVLDGGVADSSVDTAGAEADGQGEADAARPFVPIFRTDFEDGVGLPASAHDSIQVTNLGTPVAGGFPVAADRATIGFFYEGGTSEDRYARLIDDPTEPGNRVLHYWIKNAAIDAGYRNHTKGRIQTGINPGPAGYPMAALYMKTRMYLHPDLGLLTSYPPDGDLWWIGITIQELWLGAKWEGHPAPARISLRIVPDIAHGVLRLAAACDTTVDFTMFWDAQNLDFALPLGEWLTLEVGYKMGDAANGRFVVVIDGESLPEPVTVVDVTNVTYNPSAAEPVALTHWNSHKIYSSDNVLHHIRDNGGVAQIYWDDFEFSDTWPPGW